MRRDDGRFLAGPNRFALEPVAALRVTLDLGERGDDIATQLVAALRSVFTAQGLAAPAPVLVVGERTVSIGVACPNQARADLLLRLLERELGLTGDDQAGTDECLNALPEGSEAPAPAAVPVVGITGTNGKSTTTRLLARILRAAGRTPGVTTSDGVWVGEQQVLQGDFTGPRGAACALAEPGVDVGVLEVARGGLLLKGLGVPALDVGVVTNVAADHLGLNGVETVEELATVKGIIVRAVRPGGRVVLNAADWATPHFRALTPAPVVLFARDPDLRAVEQHRAAGGEALLAREGWLLRTRGGHEEALLPVREVPVTLGGIASHNVDNALAAAAAAFALGASPAAVRDGLGAFQPTPEENPGRLNVFPYDGRQVIVDFAHNAHGLQALLDVAEALARPRGGRVLAVIGTAGDRRDEDITALGEIAARRCAEVVVKETDKYLRGRTLADLLALYRAGIARAGRDPATPPIVPDEVGGLRAALARSVPGDVIAIMCQEQRQELWDLLRAPSLDPTRPTHATPAADAP